MCPWVEKFKNKLLEEEALCSQNSRNTLARSYSNLNLAVVSVSFLNLLCGVW